MSKTVKVFNTATNSVITVETTARNWGTLKGEIINQFEAADIALDVDNMSAMAKLSNSKLILGFDDTALPDENFKVYLYPEKSKSGIKKAVKWEPTVAYVKEVRSKLNKLFDHYKVESEELSYPMSIFFADVLQEELPEEEFDDFDEEELERLAMLQEAAEIEAELRNR